MTGIQLRPARPEDHDEIVACVDAAYRGYVKDIGQKPAPMLEDYGALIRANALTVAESFEGETAEGQSVEGQSLERQIVGLIAMWARPDHWYVDNVAVWPARQGSGIGSILLERAEEVARAAGFSEIRLYTNEAMISNTTYYEHRGYAETHRSTEAGYKRIYYRRELT